MNQPIYIVDAFTTELFSGNPAAVCPLDNWLSEDLMQKIAMENNLSETAFLVNFIDVSPHCLLRSLKYSISLFGD